MSFKTILLILLVGGGGYYYWNTRVAGKAAPGEATANGFVSLPPLSGPGADGIIIFAPENCSSDGARRADTLAGELSFKGIPYERSSSAQFGFTENPGQAMMDRMNAVMGGEGPIVFVRGKAKANPSLEEVIAEYEAGKS